MVLVAMVALSCLTANCNITEAARIDRLALLGVAACARGLPYFQRHLHAGGLGWKGVRAGTVLVRA